MATSKKKKVTNTDSDSYNKLDAYCIWLNEYYRSLRKAGFDTQNALWLITEPQSFPEWVPFGDVTNSDITDYLEDEDD